MNARAPRDPAPLEGPSPDQLRRARRAFLLVALILPAGLTALVLGLVLAWLPELPDPAATHWGLLGVDGTGPAATWVWSTLSVGFGIPALLAGTTLALGRRRWGTAARLLGGIAFGVSGLGAVVDLVGVGIQRGLRSATDADSIGGWMLLALVVLALGTVLGWLVQPRVRPVPIPALAPAPVPALSRGERLGWIATTRMSRRATTLLIGIVALVGGIALIPAFSHPAALWSSVPALTILALAFASTVAFRVRVDARGLRVCSPLGWPRVTVPIDRITAVRAIEVDPFGEFGGFGVRFGAGGRLGVVLRRGPALEVQRRDKGPVVVTVDEADVAAGVLQAHLDARRGPDRAARA